MADIADAVEQDAVAESLVAPVDTGAAQDTGTEDLAAQDEQATEQVAEEAGNEAEDTDWLPDEQQKVFPQEIVAKYGTRYGYSAEDIAADPRLQRTLSERMNQDIYIQQLRQNQELGQLEDPEEAKPGPTQQQQTQSLPTREQYFQNLDNIVRSKTDPEVAKQFNADFLRAFNVPEDEIAKVPQEQAMKFTQMVSKYVLNLVSTFAPDVIDPRLSQRIEQDFPGFSQAYEVTTYARAWDAVRNSGEAFYNLPQFGTRDFVTKTKEAATAIAGSPERFERMKFPDAKSPAENARMKYEMLAKHMTGQGANPALVKQAVETGMKKAKQQAQKQGAVTLGSPVNPKASTPRKAANPQFQTNADIFDDDAMEIWKRNHGSL